MTIYPTAPHGKIRWCVSWTAAGNRERRFFKTQAAAKTFAASVKADGPTGEVWAAIPLVDRIELAGLWKAAREKGYSLAEAARFWEQNGARTASTITVDDLATRFLAAKKAKNLRPESLRILGVTLEEFKAGREQTPAADVTTDQIREFIGKRGAWGPWRRRGVLIDLTNLYNWGIGAGYLVRNPAKGIERPITDTKRPAVFTPEQCRRLLQLARGREHRAVLPYVLVCLFAGLRPVEAEALRWEHIKDGVIHLEWTKGRNYRPVTIRPALDAWISICIKPRGPVCGGDHRKRMIRLREAFGTWPRDVLRHSFCSYELARTGDTARTAREAGHTEDVLIKHYARLVTPAAAREFWDTRTATVRRIVWRKGTWSCPRLHGVSAPSS